jgi:hypothetical protein
MSTVSVNSLLKQYGTEKKTKPEANEEKHRVKVGQVFCQPTKQATNFKTCYWGFYNPDGSFAAGFCMANSKVLEMVNAGHLPKACLDTLNAFAEKYAPQGKQVL